MPCLHDFWLECNKKIVYTCFFGHAELKIPRIYANSTHRSVSSDANDAMSIHIYIFGDANHANFTHMCIFGNVDHANSTHICVSGDCKSCNVYSYMYI